MSVTGVDELTLPDELLPVLSGKDCGTGTCPFLTTIVSPSDEGHATITATARSEEFALAI